MRDPYQILGVRKEAPEAVVEAAYKELVKEKHPDNGGNPEEFKKVKQAYEAITSEATNTQTTPSWFNSLFSQTEPAETLSAIGEVGDGLTIDGNIFEVKLLGILPDVDAAEIVRLPRKLGENTSRTVVLFDIKNNTDDVERWHRDNTKYIDNDGFTYERESETIDSDKLGPRWTNFSVEIEPHTRTKFVAMVEEMPSDARLEKIVHTQKEYEEGRTGGWVQGKQRYEFVISEDDRTPIPLPVEKS